MAKETDPKKEVETAKERAAKQRTSDLKLCSFLFITFYWDFCCSGTLQQFGPQISIPPRQQTKKVMFFFQALTISSEVRLILIVIMAGALGSLVHGFRSLFWYVGKEKYEKSWTLMYFLLPLVGSSLSLLFYFVLRGGLFSPQATIDATSPFGFAGVSGLVGMFSNKAADKLKEIADSIFSTTPPDNNGDTEESTEG